MRRRWSGVRLVVLTAASTLGCGALAGIDDIPLLDASVRADGPASGLDAGSKEASSGGDGPGRDGGKKGDAGDSSSTTRGTMCTQALCNAMIPPTTPAHCAAATCDTTSGVCTFASKDEDGDGHTAAKCASTNGVAIETGDDCDDHDSALYPGHDKPCDTYADGGAVKEGFCASGAISCLADGTPSACTGTLVCTNSACVGQHCVGTGGGGDDGGAIGKDAGRTTYEGGTGGGGDDGGAIGKDAGRTTYEGGGGDLDGCTPRTAGSQCIDGGAVDGGGSCGLHPDGCGGHYICHC